MHIIAVSPHLDDAVFSAGGFLADAARQGHRVELLTPLSGRVDAANPVSSWDAPRGLATAGEVSAARRVEDQAAADALGLAACSWGDLMDDGYPTEDGSVTSEAALAGVLEPALATADLVLGPGWPLVNPDHARVHRTLRRLVPAERLAVYLEQPYGLHPVRYVKRTAGLLRTGSAPLEHGYVWCTYRPSRVALAAKDTAMSAYAGEKTSLGPGWPVMKAFTKVARREHLAHAHPAARASLAVVRPEFPTVPQQENR